MTDQKPTPTMPDDEAATSDRVVVGFDGSRAAWNALRWAADEAGRRRATLEVVTCPASPDTEAEPSPAEAGRSNLSPAEQIERAAWVARRRGWQIPVRGVPAEETVGHVLVERSRGAAMLVLGAHDSRRHTDSHLSLGAYCQTNASCPVTVVTSATQPAHGRSDEADIAHQGPRIRTPGYQGGGRPMPQCHDVYEGWEREMPSDTAPPRRRHS